MALTLTGMTQQNSATVLLLGGLWLDASAWAAVGAELDRAGFRAVAVTLPGQGDGNSRAALADQVAAVVTAIDAADGPVVLVGHSAASSLAWQAADRRVDRVRRVVMVGGFPSAPGAAYADFFPVVDGAMPFPGWAPFEGPDSADLDDAAREGLARNAIPVPEAVALGIVELTDPRRHTLPVTLVCPEYSPDDARSWIAAGQIPELAAVDELDCVDIDSGHWPMFTRPRELAALLADTAREQS
jgi:pimeloyl-ACP methyl ester carboxylesterase